MRIISGIHRGRKIIAPKNLPVRPTTDMAKEALFNILNNNFDFESVKVLDLFSGTGNISYEFASRSCKEITAVDNDSGCVNYINKTAEKLNFKNLNAIKANVLSFLEFPQQQYNIIFADPPYNFSEIEKIPEMIFNNHLLIKGGWLIIEHSKYNDFKKHSNFLEHRRYGKVNFSFFLY